MEIPQRVADRLRSRIEIDENGCWLWTGAKDRGGYGRISWSPERNVKVFRGTHRVMYELEVGPIPKGLDLDHLCRVRACCNPEHLEPVTRQTNLLRGDTTPARRAAATECPYGHPYDDENTLIDTLGRRNCKACVYQRNRAYYWKNRERRKAYNKAYRLRRKAQR